MLVLCLNKHQVFEQDEVEEKRGCDFLEFWGTPVTREYVEYSCPCCGDEVDCDGLNDDHILIDDSDDNDIQDLVDGIAEEGMDPREVEEEFARFYKPLTVEVDDEYKVIGWDF